MQPSGINLSQNSNVRPFNNQSGFSLTEVLVSAIVLSIGLLGLAAMQATAYRYNHDNYLKSVAATQIDAIIDRMRANSPGIKAGHYNQYTVAAAEAAATNGEAPTIAACVNCTPEELAKVDYHHWNDDNHKVLPSGMGYISGDGQRFTVTLMWDNDRTGATGTNCSGDSAVDLTCLSMTVEL